MSLSDKLQRLRAATKITRRTLLAGVGAVTLAPKQALANGPLIDDEDLRARGNAEFIEENGIEVEHEKIIIGEGLYRITTCRKAGSRKIGYLVLHDSEDAAFDAALRGIKNGGAVIKIYNDGQRLLRAAMPGKKSAFQQIDPNRVFDLDKHPLKLLAIRILSNLKEHVEVDGTVISMHNSAPGGGFAIENLLKRPGGEFTDLSFLDRTERPDRDTQNMIIITGVTEKPSDDVKKEAAFYLQKGCNVVYEFANAKTKNGLEKSFSAYAAQPKSGITSRTVETRRGERGNRKSESDALVCAARYRDAVTAYYMRTDRKM